MTMVTWSMGVPAVFTTGVLHTAAYTGCGGLARTTDW